MLACGYLAWEISFLYSATPIMEIVFLVYMTEEISLLVEAECNLVTGAQMHLER